MDARRRPWFAFDALFPHGETAQKIYREFGRDGLLVWGCFLAACKRGQAQGTFTYITDESGWAELGLPDPTDRPGFTLDEFWTLTGQLKQTKRTRSGRVKNVSATQWGRWQNVRKSAASGPLLPTQSLPGSDRLVASDRDSDSDRTKTGDQDPARTEAAAADQPLDQDLARETAARPGTPETGEGSAAAGTPIRESDLVALVNALPGADRRSLDIVAPLAAMVTEEKFRETVARVEARDAKNPVGLLVRLLQIAIADAHRAAAEQAVAAAPPPEPVERLPVGEALDANVRALAANGRAWPDVAALVEDAFGAEHLEQARSIYEEAA